MKNRIIIAAVFVLGVLGVVSAQNANYPAGGGAPGGANTSVQFNNGGALGGFGTWTGSLLTITPAGGSCPLLLNNSGSTAQFSGANNGGFCEYTVGHNFGVSNTLALGTAASSTNVSGARIFVGAANNDFSGKLTCAANVATKTFATAYTSTPVVQVFDETTKGGVNLTAISNTAFSISCTGATDINDYIVIGNPN